MNGYFSQIAKQSGLRLTGQPDLPRPVSKSGAPTGHAPMHSEETVMVPSPLPGENALPAAGIRRDAAAVKKGPAPESRVKKEQPGTAPASDSAHAARDIGKTAGSAPPASMEKNPGTARFPDNPPAAGERSEPLMKNGAMQAGPRVIEETVFVEAAGPGAATGRNSSAEQPGRAGSTKDSGPAGAETKKYFSKTAGIIERGDTEAAEVQKILFQEVQQWVADSPAALDMAEKGLDETILTNEAAQARPREVAAVRESERAEKAERAKRPQVAEQTFDLSIGTISVVIEESEKSPRPEPPAAAGSQNVTRETKREYSRLSRHYI